MTKHLEREIETLKKKLLSLSAVVEETVYRAVMAVAERNEAVATEVAQGDERVDAAEVEVEEDCLKVLALHQPVAIDLRFLIACLKINNDLERIGDLAVNIALRAEALSKLPPTRISLDFDSMARKVQGMLRKSLEAFVNLDCRLADDVCRSDNEVDELHRETQNKIREGIRSRPEDLDALLYLLNVSRNLERIADHATNIAEDVVYMVEGRIIRHGRA